MNVKRILPIVLALASTPALASESNGLHLGLKTGSIDIDISGVDASTPLGFVVGFQKGTVGVEVELNSADLDINTGYGSASIDYSTSAIYGVLRSQGDTYFKAKAGILKQEMKSSLIGTETDSGLSLGLGAGVKLGRISLEAEYTILEADANFLSIGANFNF
jgi:hypothetical protein